MYKELPLSNALAIAKALVLFFTFTASPASAATGEELLLLKTSYKESLGQIESQHAANTAQLMNQYTNLLEQYAKSYQDKGDFANLTAVQQEIKRLQEDKAVDDIVPEIHLVALRKLRDRYFTSQEKIDVRRAEETRLLHQRYRKALEKQLALFTKQGRLDDAKLCNDEINSLSSSAELMEANEMLAKARTATKPDEDVVPTLEIRSAVWGTERRKVTVTREIKRLVVENRLSLTVNSKNGYQFGGRDPHYGRIKTLTVKYKYGGSEILTAQGTEGQTLTIPQSEVLPNGPLENSQGTGFAVSSDGLIVTAYHVVDAASAIKVRFASTDWIPATYVKGSRKHDIAILSTKQAPPALLTFGKVTNLKQGDHVFTMGYPVAYILGEDAKYTEGVISALSGLQGLESMLQITVPVQPGNSGGPLLNKEGQVVGIVISGAAEMFFYQETGSLPQNINWAVKGNYVQKLLGSEKYASSTNAEPDPVEKARQATCFIEVVK